MIRVVIQVISFLGFLGFVALASLVAFYVGDKLFKTRMLVAVIKRVRPHAYVAAFALAFIATLASLFLSEVAHFQPCILCWYQRIAMYPQVPLLYLAVVRREQVLKPYLLTLNILGAIIALYHYSLHVLPKTTTILLPCAREYGGAPCDKGYAFYFGFMTFPLMAFVVFALIIALLLMSERSHSRPQK